MTMQAEGGATPAVNGQGGGVDSAGAGASPPAPPPAPQPSQAATPSPQPVPAAAPAARVPTRKLIGDADDIPPDADLIELPPNALKSRLERYTKKQLRDAFGTDSVDAIRTKLQEHEAWRNEREQQRLAEMTESERLREQLATAQRERDEAVQRAEQIHTERVVAEQDSHVSGILGKYINPRYLKHEARNLAEYISTLSEAELSDPDAVIEAWCRKTIEEDPALAIRVAEPPPVTAPVAAPVPAAAPQTRPLTNGAAVQRPPNVAQGGIVAPKTYAPGTPGSASDKEWREFKRQNGWNF